MMFCKCHYNFLGQFLKPFSKVLVYHVTIIDWVVNKKFTTFEIFLGYLDKFLLYRYAIFTGRPYRVLPAGIKMLFLSTLVTLEEREVEIHDFCRF